MAIGTRKRGRQPAMWVATTELPTAASHRRLNQLLREHWVRWFRRGAMRRLLCDRGKRLLRRRG